MLPTPYEDTPFSTFFLSVLNFRGFLIRYISLSPSAIAFFLLVCVNGTFDDSDFPSWSVEHCMIKIDDCSYWLLLLVSFSNHYPHCSFLQLLEMFDVEYPILFDNQNAISKLFNPFLPSRVFSQRFFLCRGIYCHIISSSSFRAFLIHRYLENFPPIPH